MHLMFMPSFICTHHPRISFLQESQEKSLGVLRPLPTQGPQHTCDFASFIHRVGEDGVESELIFLGSQFCKLRLESTSFYQYLPFHRLWFINPMFHGDGEGGGHGKFYLSMSKYVLNACLFR